MCCENETSKTQDNLAIACSLGILPELAERYIEECRSSGRLLPNLAGFCRHCGFEGHAPERLRRDYPESYAELCLIFEDEALNSKVSASVLSAYLKRRLGYDGAEVEQSPCELGPLKLIFEHDVLTDGE